MSSGRISSIDDMIHPRGARPGNDMSVHKPYHPLHQSLSGYWKLEHECSAILSVPQSLRQGVCSKCSSPFTQFVGSKQKNQRCWNRRCISREKEKGQEIFHRRNAKFIKSDNNAKRSLLYVKIEVKITEKEKYTYGVHNVYKYDNSYFAK